MWNCSVTLFLICLLEATTSNRIRGISILPLPFHTKLSWLPSHWFCEKSGFTAFHSYELASFFILSWIWLPTCSGSILSVQVSVGGWLIRGENQRTVVSLPFCLQNVPVWPALHPASHATTFFSYLKCRGKLKKRKSYCRESLHEMHT